MSKYVLTFLGLDCLVLAPFQGMFWVSSMLGVMLLGVAFMVWQEGS